MAVKKVRLGQVLQQASDVQDVHGELVYPQIGMLNFGRGTFKKSDLLGSETKYRTFQQVHAGQVIYSKLKAFEGALSIVPADHDEHFVSQEFPTFDLNRNDVDPSYLLQVFRSEPFAGQLAQGSKGVGARRERLHPTTFLNIEIPLPPIDEQLRIAARLDSLRDAVDRVDRSDHAAIAAVDRIEAELVSGVLGDGVPLRDFVEINPSPEKVPADIDVVFAPMAALDVERGTLAGAGVLRRSEVGAGYKQFSRGDIVFARITPSMQNGKSAIFDDPQRRIGYGTTEFHVIRAKSPELTTAIHALVRSTWFKSLAMRSFTGTAGQQRVPAVFLRNVLVPNINDPRVRHAIENLKDLEDDRWRLRGLANRRRELATALPKAVRNEIFSKLV